MSEKYKHLEGAVPVNGDITPISRKPISKINSNKWEDLSYDALCDQYTNLESRITLVRSMGRSDLEKEMQRGLIRLQRIMQEKRPDEEDITLL